MTFNTKAHVLLNLLDQVGQGLKKRQRGQLKIKLSAGKRTVSIIGNGLQASIELPTRDQAQCEVNWRTFHDILSTFPPDREIVVKCENARLCIDSFSMDVEGFQTEAVGQATTIPQVEQKVRPRAKKLSRQADQKESPPNSPAPDGYSLRKTTVETDDCTGKPGKVAPEDSSGPREPIVCPVCNSVGYFKKVEYMGRPYYEHRRSWAVARMAATVVTLRGDEKTGLCPRCQHERLWGRRYIAPIEGEQADFYEEPTTGHEPPPRQ
jgi:hypothetical protein